MRRGRSSSDDLNLALKAAQRDKVRLAAELASAREGAIEIALRERDEAFAAKEGLQTEIARLKEALKSSSENCLSLEASIDAMKASLLEADEEKKVLREKMRIVEEECTQQKEARESLLLQRNAKRKADSLAERTSSITKAVGSVADAERRAKEYEEMRLQVAVAQAELRRAEDDASAANTGCGVNEDTAGGGKKAQEEALHKGEGDGGQCKVVRAKDAAEGGVLRRRGPPLEKREKDDREVCGAMWQTVTRS